MSMLAKNRIYNLLFGLILIVPLSLQLRPIAIPVGSFYITLVEGAVIFLIVAWPFRQLTKRENLLRQTYLGRYVFILIIMYSVYLLFGLVFFGPVLALGDFRQYLPLFLFFPMVSYFHSAEAVKRLRQAVFWVLVLVAFYSVVLFIFFNDFLAAKAIEQDMRVLGNRIYMVNSLAVLFAYLGYATASVFNPGSSFKHKAICLAIIGLNGLMVLFMQSRSLWAMFAIIIFLSIFSLKNNLVKFKFIFLGGYALIFLIATAYLSANVFDYTPSVVRRIQSSVVDRLVSFTELGKVGQRDGKKTASIGTLETRLETAKRVTKDHIIPNLFLGSGFGSQIPMVDSRGNIFKWKFQVDNAYLTILAKFGLLGFLVYFLFTLKIIRCLLKIIRSPDITDEDAMLAKSFLYMMIAIVMGSLTSSIFIRQQPLIVGFLIMLCETERLARKYITPPQE